MHLTIKYLDKSVKIITKRNAWDEFINIFLNLINNFKKSSFKKITIFVSTMIDFGTP